MAVVHRKPNYHIRPPNKEPEWSNLCNNVFDQYLEGNDLFDLGESNIERSSSDDSGNLFDFSGSSEQSHQTSASSPNHSVGGAPSVQSVETEAKQPKAKAPGDFWTKKLRALERNAAECEKRQQKLRSTKSHPDFLSLGGYPSPPALPPSPTSQSYSAKRQISRAYAANGQKTPTQRSVTNIRSVSRGRPIGVTKQPPASASAAINPWATIRKSNASPSKMMNPSRYRAGFKDVWAERIQNSPKKFEIRLPSSQTFPDSPPPSARSMQDAFAAFGSPMGYGPPMPGCDDQISPLASTFQHAARIHTPIASPLLSPGGHGQLSYFDAAPPLPTNIYAPQTVPLNDTAPLCDDVSLATNGIQSFDFGFSSSPTDDAWSAAPFAEPSMAPMATRSFTQPFADINNNNFGLGISCDPNLVSNYTTMPETTLMPDTASHSPPMSAQNPFYVPSLPNGLPLLPTRGQHRSQPHGLPTTPRRNHLSRSPSPPATESRRPRRASRHRRTKSTNSTPRKPQDKPGAGGGGFVNYTPSDSNKILSGVAPSGSSKTKARREKEAADKRRRLSQAAMRAVMEAGGDVEALQKAGLLGVEP